MDPPLIAVNPKNIKNRKKPKKQNGIQQPFINIKNIKKWKKSQKQNWSKTITCKQTKKHKKMEKTTETNWSKKTICK